MTDAIHIISPGSYTTVQDMGRCHAYHMGVPVSGSLDDYAHRIANWLVGNSSDCAVLEMSMIGAQFDVLCDADMAVTGARMNLRVNGRPCPEWTSIRVRPGDVVELGMAENGCRAYLAIGGGIDVSLVMGSRSTYVGGQLGGLKGRLLLPEDILPRGEGRLLNKQRSLPWVPLYPENIFIRAIPGPHDDFFRNNMDMFFSSFFTVTAQSNRMGCRLVGPEILRDPDAPQSIVSEPIMPGNVQVPADGQPIVLLKEQTIGGYTNIATVISSDIFRMAQARPGDTVQFIHVTLDEAHRIYRDWIRFLDDIKVLLND
ncbi:MAG TPA: biotin-dependent carboxyltransferase family protein [Deltaproteobacteria bacterium]|nr:biotin-dependent carboxyltransferase family protein [Deltaproteobacteria bacterium]